MHCRSCTPALNASISPGGFSLLFWVVCCAFCTKWAKWVGVEVPQAKDLMTGREFGVDSGPSQEIESEDSLWDEVAPCVWGPGSVSAIEDGDEVCFECLHCSFSWVPSVHAGVDWLAFKELMLTVRLI